MPQQFIITGNVFLSDNGNPLLEGKVQVFDRDLPSIERRGAAPQFLGESSLDANGRFRIEYTDEQFRKGEGELAIRRGISKINPDLSFSIFAPSGRKLPITQLGEVNRELLADRIIFNAPTELEVVIYVETRQEIGDSEYERIVAAIAPVLEDLPIAELIDEDIQFLVNELGLGQSQEDENRLEWLRRSALLAQETSLPIEAFYGWGRKDTPNNFTELAEYPIADFFQGYVFKIYPGAGEKSGIKLP